MNVVKYPGGKERELDVIHAYLPQQINNYYEPFVGGGSVYLSMQAQHYYINDFSVDLMTLYQCVASGDRAFFDSMTMINNLWKAIGLYVVNDTCLFTLYVSYRDSVIDEAHLKAEIASYVQTHMQTLIGFVAPLGCGHTDVFLSHLTDDCLKKFIRMKELNFTKKVISDEDIRANILGIFKASFYMYIRFLYNHMDGYSDGLKAMLYLFIRDFCYSSMFRFNANGEFNVPYGGISYNNKNYDKIFEKYKSDEMLDHMRHTTFGCMDYKEFLKQYVPKTGDFMFVDPPYDSSFSTYDQNVFDAEAQRQLAHYLLNECQCNFMLDIKATDFIRDLYRYDYLCANGQTLRIIEFDKRYSVSFMNRNDQSVEHLVIMNYGIGGLD